MTRTIGIQAVPFHSCSVPSSSSYCHLPETWSKETRVSCSNWPGMGAFDGILPNGGVQMYRRSIAKETAC